MIDIHKLIWTYAQLLARCGVKFIVLHDMNVNQLQERGH